MRKTVLAAAISLSLSPGCRAMLPAVEEPIRLQNADDIESGKLGFVKGRTSFKEAEGMMRGIGLTGIYKTIYTDISTMHRSPVLNAITADYQSKVHIFLNDAYLESVKLHSGSMLPYGPAITIASGEGKVLLLALYRDALEMTFRNAYAQEPRIEVFEQKDGSFSFSSIHLIGALVAENNGISRPIFIGHDLDVGVLMLARDREGVIWDGGYFIRYVEGKLKTVHVYLEEASRCPCVNKYIYGGSIESIWEDR